MRGEVAVESRFALNNVWSPMLGREILGAAAPQQSVLSSGAGIQAKVLPRIRSTIAHLWADVLHAAGSAPSTQRSANACCETASLCHYWKNTVYINLAGCWIMFERRIYEVEKSRGEATWHSKQREEERKLAPAVTEWRETGRSLPVRAMWHREAELLLTQQGRSNAKP